MKERQKAILLEDTTATRGLCLAGVHHGRRQQGRMCIQQVGWHGAWGHFDHLHLLSSHEPGRWQSTHSIEFGIDGRQFEKRAHGITPVA
jgi:hypothetical protein